MDIHQLDEDLKDEVSYGVRTQVKRSKKNVVVGEEGLAAKIKYFETANPKDVLRVLQNNTKPARADLNILSSLAEDYHLVNPVINVIIDFVLQMNNNVLSKYSVEKIASSISREGVETAIDAMEYLNNNYTGGKKNNETKTSKVSNPNSSRIKEEVSSKEDMSDEEIETLRVRYIEE